MSPRAARRVLPAAAALLAAALLWPSRPARVRGFDAAAFGELPVLQDGRVKPLETVARSSLLVLRGRQSLREGGTEVGPLEWLLALLARPEQAASAKLFRVEDSDLLGLLGAAQQQPRDFSLEELRARMGELMAEFARASALDASRRSAFDSAVVNLGERLTLCMRLERSLGPRAGDGAAFEPPALRGGREAYDGLVRAYAAGDAAAFNGGLADLRARLSAERPAELAAARREALFDRAEPFYRGMLLYIVVLILSLCCLAPRLRPRLARPTLALLGAALLVHTAGVAFRVLLQGRPPVTNLYSSAVFVGWTAAALGAWLESRRRDGLGALAASAIGFPTLIIAHHLETQGDTMEMMRAVLDSNFWLTTHVVTITLGYGAMFVAAAFAHVFLLRRYLDPERPLGGEDRSLASLVYGVLCAALFLSFLGTVLGGIWADQSWGRFWGWDPKENGALLIVLWTALVLHARWGGFIRERGVCLAAVFGAVVTSFSWFGVNMLGVGLHSYGFMNRAVPWLAGFCAFELAVMGLGAFTAPA